MKIKRFVYKGIKFTFLYVLDSDKHSFVLMHVFHKGNDLTDFIDDKVLLRMEDKLNDL